MKVKSYYPVLASWIITLLFCGTNMGVRFYGFPKWMDLSNLSELATVFFGLIILGGPILSLLWGVGGLMENKEKKDFIIALVLSVLWSLPFLIVFALGLSGGANSIVARLFSYFCENSFCFSLVWDYPMGMRFFLRNMPCTHEELCWMKIDAGNLKLCA